MLISVLNHILMWTRLLTLVHVGDWRKYALEAIVMLFFPYIIRECCDWHDPSISLALWSFSLLLLLSSWLMHVPLTMRLCNSRILEEHLVCYQTSQRNWVIIKMLYRCLRTCLLRWHRSRLGFVTPCIKEVSLGPLGNAHHYKPCKQCD